MKEDEGGAAGRGAAGLAPERSARASAPARAPPRARPGTKHTFVTDPPWCQARAGTEDSYRHTHTRPFVSPATIRFLVAASDDTHAPPGPVYPRSGSHSAPTPSAGSTRRHANTWPSHPPLTSTRPRVGTSTSSKRSTDHVCVCASTRAYRPSAHRRSVVAAAAKMRFAAAPRFERVPVDPSSSSRRGGARWAEWVSRDSRRVRDVVGSNPGGGGSAAPRAARCRIQRCSASAAARHARHAEDAAARLLGGSARNTRFNTSPGRSKDAVALGSGCRSFESHDSVVDFFPGEGRGVRGRGDAGVGERLGPVEGDALVPSRSGETETKTGGRLGAGRSERGGGGVGNNDAGRAKARRRGVEGGVVSGAAGVDGGDDGAGGVDSATRSAGSATREAIDAIDAIDRGAAMDRSRWIDGGVGLFEASGFEASGFEASTSAPSSRIGGARRRKPNAVAADDRSIAPVKAARDAAVRARSARMVAATRAAALDRERPREGNRVRTSPPASPGLRGAASPARRRGAGRRRRPGGSESAIGEAAPVAISEVVARWFVSRRFASGLASMTVRVIVPRRGVAGLARGGKSGGSRDASALAPGGSSRNAATTFRIPRALRRASGTSGLGTDSAKARARVADGSIEGGRGWFERASPRRRARRRSTRIGRRTTAGDAREGERERRWSRAGPCPRVVPEVGRTSGGASASPRAGTRASSTWWPCLRIREGRDGRMRQTNGGKGRGTHISSIETRTGSRTRRTRRPPRSSSPSDEPGPRGAADQSASGHIDADASRDDATTLGESHGVVTRPRRASARCPGRDARVRFRRRRVRETWRARRVMNPSDATRRTRRR